MSRAQGQGKPADRSARSDTRAVSGDAVGRDRPIIFSAPMVRALLDGRKTMTRRILSSGTATVNGYPYRASEPAWAGLRLNGATARTKSPWTGLPDPHLDVPWEHPEDAARGVDSETFYRVRPRVEAGDRLWVKETWAVGSIYDGIKPSKINPASKPDWCGIRYAATDERIGLKDRTPLFMPRWASRLTLIVESVKVERLQDISEADAVAEGIGAAPGGWFSGAEGQAGTTARAAYALLWNSIHGKSAWDANPWVAALSFRVVAKNIDTPRGRP